MTEGHARISPALVEGSAGLAAGTITTLAVHPLDVIKTRLQSTSLHTSKRIGLTGLQFTAAHLRYRSMGWGYSDPSSQMSIQFKAYTGA